jgi:hypothetical protein
MHTFLNHEMAQARQADLLREAEEYRRAGRTTRPVLPARVTALIARVVAGIRPRRGRALTTGRRPARGASHRPGRLPDEPYRDAGHRLV